ncbi:hypothetical protein KC19_2G161800 [Ceratodon purpureus]|uniref:Uncharacterized protein n=1 Tax=Ceratodon purpureus TaxID=3225 RepID=A0A8T0IUI5_CERPU|nr:hypothetical protein KC19_2G161800 [Ceratodon purpureus]
MLSKIPLVSEASKQKALPTLLGYLEKFGAPACHPLSTNIGTRSGWKPGEHKAEEAAQELRRDESGIRSKLSSTISNRSKKEMKSIEGTCSALGLPNTPGSPGMSSMHNNIQTTTPLEHAKLLRQTLTRKKTASNARSMHPQQLTSLSI